MTKMDVVLRRATVGMDGDKVEYDWGARCVDVRIVPPAIEVTAYSDTGPLDALHKLKRGVVDLGLGEFRPSVETILRVMEIEDESS